VIGFETSEHPLEEVLLLSLPPIHQPQLTKGKH
jgi:hypothetical protein